jgi:hypothetical protein
MVSALRALAATAVCLSIAAPALAAVSTSGNGDALGTVAGITDGIDASASDATVTVSNPAQQQLNADAERRARAARAREAALLEAQLAGAKELRVVYTEGEARELAAARAANDAAATAATRATVLHRQAETAAQDRDSHRAAAQVAGTSAAAAKHGPGQSAALHNDQFAAQDAAARAAMELSTRNHAAQTHAATSDIAGRAAMGLGEWF